MDPVSAAFLALSIIEESIKLIEMLKQGDLTPEQKQMIRDRTATLQARLHAATPIPEPTED
jgi:hypothetical protein